MNEIKMIFDMSRLQYLELRGLNLKSHYQRALDKMIPKECKIVVNSYKSLNLTK